MAERNLREKQQEINRVKDSWYTYHDLAQHWRKRMIEQRKALLNLKPGYDFEREESYMHYMKSYGNFLQDRDQTIVDAKKLARHLPWLSKVHMSSQMSLARCENEHKYKGCGGWYCREGNVYIGVGLDVLSVGLIPFGGLPSGVATGFSIANNVITMVACNKYAVPAASTALNVGSLTGTITKCNKASIGFVVVDATINLASKYYVE